MSRYEGSNGDEEREKDAVKQEGTPYGRLEKFFSQAKAVRAAEGDSVDYNRLLDSPDTKAMVESVNGLSPEDQARLVEGVPGTYFTMNATNDLVKIFSENTSPFMQAWEQRRMEAAKKGWD